MGLPAKAFADATGAAAQGMVMLLRGAVESRASRRRRPRQEFAVCLFSSCKLIWQMAAAFHLLRKFKLAHD
jgi:hypothetical protein